jgi:hypothetical protein
MHGDKTWNLVKKTAHRETRNPSQNNTKMQPELQPKPETNTETAHMGAATKLET